MNWLTDSDALHAENLAKTNKQIKDAQEREAEKEARKNAPSPYLAFGDIVTGTIEKVAIGKSNSGTVKITLTFVENDETEGMYNPKDHPYKNRRFTTKDFWITPNTIGRTFYFGAPKYFETLAQELGKIPELGKAFPVMPSKMTDMVEVAQGFVDFAEGLEYCTIIGGEEYMSSKTQEVVTKGTLQIKLPGKACNEESDKYLNQYKTLSGWTLLDKLKEEDKPAPSTTPEVGGTTENSFSNDDLPF